MPKCQKREASITDAPNCTVFRFLWIKIAPDRRTKKGAASPMALPFAPRKRTSKD